MKQRTEGKTNNNIDSFHNRCLYVSESLKGDLNYKKIILKVVLVALLAAFLPFVYGCSSQESTEGKIVGGIEEFDVSENVTSSDSAYVSDMEYEDNNISIKIEKTRQYDTSVFIAHVQVSDPEYLQTAFAQDRYLEVNTKDENKAAKKEYFETPSVMAERHGAIFAVNGDPYTYRHFTYGHSYVIRDGEIYCDKTDSDKTDLLIYQDGSFGLAKDSDATAQEFVDSGVEQLLNFGPVLVENGEVTKEAKDAKDAWDSNGRCAIGIIEPGEYVFAVSDARLPDEKGLSLGEIAQVMKDEGCSIAYNLDGGGSALMWFNGEVLNRPVHTDEVIEERAVADIIYIGY